MMRIVLVPLIVAACNYPRTEAEPAIDAPDTDAPANDSAIDGVDAPTCQQGTRRCSGNDITECQSGSWTTIQTCTNFCALGGCVTPASCSGGVNLCGDGDDGCCVSLPAPSGMFSRSFDGVTTGYTDDRFRATLTPFHLDKFEVTRLRFQRFADAYPGSKPATGTGANPRDASDTGWRAEWTALLPTGRTELDAMMICDGVSAQMAHHPMRCVTWYVAQAFCIWDGGRLPTEAEWNFAASGGDQQRVYPWSEPPSSTTISASNAVYAQAAPGLPGALAAGASRWLHADLAGNISEWMFDNSAEPYPSETCNDCANHSAASARVVRGGSYANVAAALIASFRTSFPPGNRSELIGFRCARDPMP